MVSDALNGVDFEEFNRSRKPRVNSLAILGEDVEVARQARETEKEIEETKAFADDQGEEV